MVEVEGVVHSRYVWNQELALSLVTGSGRLRVSLPYPPGSREADHLVDTAVRLRGVCGGKFNKKRQLSYKLTGPIIYVQDLADVAVELKSPRRIFRKFRYAPRNSSCSSPRGAPWVIESGCGERSRTSSRDGPNVSALFATGPKAYGSSLSRSSNFHPETGSKRWGFRRSANTHRCSRTRACAAWGTKSRQNLS
ncbi:MAG: hypothetical protein DMG57_34400 [Acidobacteria bacterium]|nr:MAG: hypothetical protein DMG57_34400 [Acidobacteriota bacterium]